MRFRSFGPTVTPISSFSRQSIATTESLAEVSERGCLHPQQRALSFGPEHSKLPTNFVDCCGCGHRAPKLRRSPTYIPVYFPRKKTDYALNSAHLTV